MHKHHAHVRLFITLLTLVVLGIALYAVLLYLNSRELAIANPPLPKQVVVPAKPKPIASTTTVELIEVTDSTTQKR